MKCINEKCENKIFNKAEKKCILHCKKDEQNINNDEALQEHFSIELSDYIVKS